MSDALYDSILRELSGGAIRSLDTRSETLQFIMTFFEAGVPERALELVPKLDNMEYEQNRIDIAKLAGVRASALDELRKKPAQEQEKQGRALSLPGIQPTDEPQDGVKLLDDISTQIRRFIIADQSNIDAITLWVVFAHFAQRAPVCPNLVISSATKACGKSTALDVVSKLVPKPLSVSSITPAALFRAIQMLSPTIIVDEADAMFRQNDDLRTLVNAGFTRSAAQVIRVVGDDLEPRIFNVYSPKAIALIGSLPDTIESRSINIRMRRRLPNEPIERLRSDCDQSFQPLLARIARWVIDNCEKILQVEPEIDPALSDRQADVWRELLRIADHAGGEWPQRAKIAALELCAKQSDDGDLSIRLLSDIQKIFSELPERVKWPSQAIVDELNALDDAPWHDFNNYKGISTNRLARMLARFEIRTINLRDSTKVPKGYSTDSFRDVFSRYLQNNRYTATNTDNTLPDKELECSVNVAVADGNRYIQSEGQLFDSTEDVFKDEPTFTNDDLAIVGRVFGQLVESEKARTGENTVGICIAGWKLASAAQGISFEAFDAAKAYYDGPGYYQKQKGYVQFTA